MADTPQHKPSNQTLLWWCVAAIILASMIGRGEFLVDLRTPPNSAYPAGAWVPVQNYHTIPGGYPSREHSRSRFQ